MNLSDYLQQNDISMGQFAHDIGVEPQAIGLWKAGLRTPRPHHQKKIFQLTGGQVSPNDWVGVHTKPPREKRGTKIPEKGNTRSKTRKTGKLKNIARGTTSETLPPNSL